MMPVTSTSPEDAGFTLLEILVALALVAAIATTMATAITQLRPMQALQQRLEQERVADVLVDTIAHDLEAALRLPIIEAGSNSGMLLKGDAGGIAFTAVIRTGFQRQGLREVNWKVVGTEDAARLLRTIKLRRFSDEDDAFEPRTDEIHAGWLDLRFSYLLTVEPGRQEWRDEFVELNRLPRAVSISLGLAKAPERRAMRVVFLGLE